MTATNHVIAGAVIATYAHNPWLALPLAFTSHFLMDSLPHFDAPVAPGVFDFKYFAWLSVDFGLASSVLAVLFLLQPAQVVLILACAVAAASPDLMWLYYLVLGKGPAKHLRPWLVRFHDAIQKYTGPKWWPIELSWFLASGSLLLSRLR